MRFSELVEYWRLEVSNKKRVKSRIGLGSNIIARARKHNTARYLFFFRLSQYLYQKGGITGAYGSRMHRKLNLVYGVDIGLRAKIGPGLKIAHLPGIVISGYVNIGRNFTIRQNTTVGIKTLGREDYSIYIGDDVSVGANCCIIADHITIGDRVTIGAMSFVNKDIPSDNVFYTKR